MSKFTLGVPMSVEDLPRPFPHEVIELPPRPADWQLIHEEDFRSLPDRSILPKRRPNKAAHLATLEWAWSPMNNRIAQYWLRRRGRYWMLWTAMLDDGVWPWRWEWELQCMAPARGVNEYTAACWLLIESLKNEDGLDHFHFLSEEGLLETEDMGAIGRYVWPDHEEDAED